MPPAAQANLAAGVAATSAIAISTISQRRKMSLRALPQQMHLLHLGPMTAALKGQAPVAVRLAFFFIFAGTSIRPQATPAATRAVGRSFIRSCAVPAIRPIMTAIFQARS